MTIKVSCENSDQFVLPTQTNHETVFKVNPEMVHGRYAYVMAMHPSLSEQPGLMQVTSQLRALGIRELFLEIPYLPYSASDATADQLQVFMGMVNSIGAKQIATWYLPPNQPNLSRKLSLVGYDQLFRRMLNKHPGLALGDMLVVASSARDIENSEKVAEALNTNVSVCTSRGGCMRDQEYMHELWVQNIGYHLNDANIPSWANLLSTHALICNMTPARHFAFTDQSQPEQLFLQVR